MNLSAARSRMFKFSGRLSGPFSGLIFGLAVAVALSACAGAQQPSNRILGTVTAVSSTSVTVKTDAGATVEVTVPDTAKILKTAPGQKTLAGATKIGLSGIGPGDRVLMLAPGTPPVAAIVIVNKKSDLQALQQRQREEWQRNGIGGLVKSVNTADGTVTITSGARTITVHTTPSTVFRRYAPDSVKFSDAQPSTLAEIHAGDQVQVLGQKSGNGADVTASQVVSGSFRNIAGLVTSVDASAGTFRVKDWMTKKTVTIHVTPDSDMRRIEPEAAKQIAMELSAGKPDHGGQAAWHQGGGNAAPGAAQASGHWQGGEKASGGGNALARALAASPEIHVSDLHKGDAVMVVATSGSPDSATAIRVVTGIEAMLQASAKGSQSMFSSAWSLGGGSSGGASGGDMGGGEPSGPGSH